jgi:hypothetical protein
MAFDEARGVCVLFGGIWDLPKNDTWVWDGHVWTIMSNTGPAARSGHSMVYDTNSNRVILFGGSTHASGSLTFLNDTWAWDGSRWTLLAPGGSGAPAPRDDFALAYDSARNRIVLFGGNTGTGTLGDTWEFDGTVWSEVETRNSPAARSEHTMAFDPVRGVTVMYGGLSQGLAADPWEWDGTAWTERSASSDAGGRFLHHLMFDPTLGEVVSIGGASENATFPAWPAWKWNGTTWQAVGSPTPEPLRVPGADMAYDSQRERSVVFGGQSAPPDTWEFDGTSWLLRATTGPEVSSDYALAYDSIHRVTVYVYGNVLGGSTWLWNGTSWQSVGSNAIQGSSNGMAFDSGRGVAVLFDERRRTWEWNGSVWSMVSGAGPSARTHARLAYDSARQRTVLFGGDDRATLESLNDTWEWDGATWVERNPAQSPSSRSRHDLTYDSVRNRIVLFGGTGPRDTWEWDGVNWTLVDTLGPAANSSMAFEAARNQIVLLDGSGSHSTWVRRVGPPGPDPTFARQPADYSVETFQGAASFAVEVQGGMGLSYQWRRNSVPLVDDNRISGATTGTLSINPALPADAGEYDVVVFNACTSVTSEPATLSVFACPVDINRDGLANSQDFFDFLTAYFIFDPIADFDGSGTIDSQDFFAFLDAFFVGC